MKSVGLIHGEAEHHLDHLLPLCALYGMPLIVTEPSLKEKAERYYPATCSIIHVDPLSLPFYVVENFETVFVSLPRDLFDEIFLMAQMATGKKLEAVWCPHGNSDKGHASYFMEALHKEEKVLVYGQKMLDFLKKKGAFSQLKSHTFIGNYRYAFFKKHEEFYQKLIAATLEPHLEKGNRTLLFAPTWQDAENSSTFFEAAPSLIEKLPAHTNLIIKPHPNLLIQEKERVEEIVNYYQGKKNLLFLFDFPPIYPLLSRVDVYIGDMSSIGYDFLTFNRPMFFLNKNRRVVSSDEGLYLYRCGREVQPEEPEEIDRLYQIIDETEESAFSEIRRRTYQYTFEE